MPGFAAGSPPRWRRAVCLLVASGFAFVSVTGGPTRATAQTAPAAAALQRLTPPELEQLLAPIALYPDQLLMQVLMAATYPLEVVQAQRWAGQGDHARLSGDALAKALEAEPWDPSVKSLVPFPQVLGLMSEQLDWTQRLGDAVLGQQTDVLDAVQVLRGRALDAGKLADSPQQVVTKTAAAAGQPQVIVIQPAQPQQVYVPVYNPGVVYGPWPYPTYPPVYYPPPPSYGIGDALLTGMAFAAGVAVVGSLWGWARPGWGYGRGRVDVDVNRYNNINVNRTQITNNTWVHDGAHRGAVPYRDRELENRYRPGGDAGRIGDRPAGPDGREALRGRTEQVNRGGLDAARPAAAKRPDATRQMDRSNVANRPPAQARPAPAAEGRPQVDRGAIQNRAAAQPRPAARPQGRPQIDRGAIQDRAPAQPRPTARPEGRPQIDRPAARPAAAHTGGGGGGGGGAGEGRIAAARAGGGGGHLRER